MIESQMNKEFLYQAVYLSLKEGIGFIDDIAHRLSKLVLVKLQKLWGGRMLYIPAPGHCERNRKVIQSFNSRNHNKVCKAFNISLSTLYRIIKR